MRPSRFWATKGPWIVGLVALTMLITVTIIASHAHEGSHWLAAAGVSWLILPGFVMMYFLIARDWRVELRPALSAYERTLLERDVMFSRMSRTTAADRHGARDALVRLKATITVLDEELRKPETPLQQDLVGSLRPDLDVPTTLRELERELIKIEEQAALLRRRRDRELTLSGEWSKRQQTSAGESRPDLAAQAGVREAQQRQSADEMTRELDQFEALAREYGVIVAELRRRIDNASTELGRRLES